MKMKLSSRPISSPGRVEKFPPPLMRFLRTNAASRSRGSRSRASPIFIKQRTTGSAPLVAADTKEPSSPKVTCMGQVRVRRSKQGTRKPGRPVWRWCRWIPRILFCQGSKCRVRVRFPLFQRSKCCTPGWPKWGSLFWFGPRGGSGKGGFGGRGEDFRDRTEDAIEEEEDDEEIEGKGNCLVSSSCSPPKNALILTRCRSAPYTSSSLAYRFWGSPFEPEKTEHRRSVEKTEYRRRAEKTEHRPSTEKMAQANGRLSKDGGEWTETYFSDEYPPDGEPAIVMDDIREATNSEGTGSPIGNEDLVAAKSENGEGMQARDGDTDAEAARPLMLTRCKSEPARTAEKLLDPEVVMSGGFWRKTRLGIVDSCSPRAL